ncbi:uncharacterized protein LOC127643460 isoform X2 [Xyrauchen texanus]|uniref:uncharacterized protein LOC127643460 isoform X2 n=1 Tax=Xyrauchen texanus TaxID=154827 RepID=UPI002241FEB1|nr:uncharacterized protein LOC127643460 isoform X2 [Xyrauchen texanus]
MHHEVKKSIEKILAVTWTNDKSGIVARRRENKKDAINDGFRLEVDGSLTFINIRLTESGLYDFRVYNSEGTETGRGQNKMKVYAKVPKPDLKSTCNTDGNVTLTCNAGNGEDLQYTWFDRTNPIENKHTKTLILPVAKVNNPYSCSAKNPVSEARSENKTVTCQDVKKAVGDDVKFRPDNIPSPTVSIIWKHKDNDGIMVKAIEWDTDDVDVPNPKFKDIATLDEKTGEITLTGLKLHHSGVYTIEINSKEQQNKFTLTVMVSGEECKENQLEGTSCTMKLKSREKTAEVKWTNDKSVIIARRKKNKDTVKDGFRLEVDGSLTFINIRVTESGLYDFSTYDSVGTETGRGQNKIKVYAKVPKPDLKWTCNTDGNVTLTCNAGNGEDLQYTWFDRTNPIENKHTKTLILPLEKVNNQYSCSAKNPVSEARSESKTVTCQDVKRAVGDDVTFRPDNIPSPTTSILWKHTDNDGIMVKVIEWEPVDGVDVPNPKFKDIATLDEKTGEITLTGLKLHHSGVYSIEINSKEQQNKFTLTVMEPVPKPEIRRETSSNHDAKYLICDGDATIIWKNSAGETLSGTPISGPPKGESITVNNTRNRDNYYTCTLKNDVSEKTSDRVYEKDLFTEPVPKPEIRIETSKNHDVKSLNCYGDATIIWKNSAGDTLSGTPISGSTKGESLTVKNTRNRDNYYTCTLQNDVSEKTSDPVYEKDLFSSYSSDNNPGPSTGLIVFLVILLVLLFLGIAACLLYICHDKTHESVHNSCGNAPILGGVLRCLDRCRKNPGTDKNENPDNAANQPLKDVTASPKEGKIWIRSWEWMSSLISAPMNDPTDREEFDKHVNPEPSCGPCIHRFF